MAPPTMSINTRAANAMPSPQDTASLPSTPALPQNPARLSTSATTSLYQQCLLLHNRLHAIPGFDKYFEHSQNLPQSSASSILPSPSTPLSSSLLSGAQDPVSSLWNTFRMGEPLSFLFNLTKPETRIELPSEKSQDGSINLTSLNACKAQVYHFLIACRNQLNYAEDDVFTITELYQDDTSGLVKVIRLVTSLLDKLESEGLIPPPGDLFASIGSPTLPGSNHSSIYRSRSSLRISMGAGLSGSEADMIAEEESSTGLTKRQKVIDELLETERKYVVDLENLQGYMNHVASNDILPPDQIPLLFANLNALVDFQRKFLIGLENILVNVAPDEERIGALFVQSETSFSVYEPFCANYKAASDLVIEQTPNLMKAASVVEPTYELPSLLIKPIQRICKYPLLLNELVKCTDSSNPYYEELKQGLDAIKRVTDRVNETRRKEENEVVKEDLERRVEDWKGHDPAAFGSLLLFDKFTMSINDIERDLHIFLFEKIILCCKETVVSTAFGGILKSKKKDKDKDKNMGYQIKGRIWMGSVTGVIPDAKAPSLKVFWKSAEMQSFTLKIRNEEQLKLWQSTLQKCVDRVKERRRRAATAPSQRSRSTPPSRNSRDVLTSKTESFPSSSSQLSSSTSMQRTLSTASNSSSAAGGEAPPARPKPPPPSARLYNDDQDDEEIDNSFMDNNQDDDSSDTDDTEELNNPNDVADANQLAFDMSSKELLEVVYAARNGNNPPPPPSKQPPAFQNNHAYIPAGSPNRRSVQRSKSSNEILGMSGLRIDDGSMNSSTGGQVPKRGISSVYATSSQNASPDLSNATRTYSMALPGKNGSGNRSGRESSGEQYGDRLPQSRFSTSTTSGSALTSPAIPREYTPSPGESREPPSYFSRMHSQSSISSSAMSPPITNNQSASNSANNSPNQRRRRPSIQSVPSDIAAPVVPPPTSALPPLPPLPAGLPPSAPSLPNPTNGMSPSMRQSSVSNSSNQFNTPPASNTSSPTPSSRMHSSATNSPIPNPRTYSKSNPQSTLPLQPSQPQTSAPPSPQVIKIKTHYRDDIYVIMVPRSTTYSSLLEKIEKKIKFCAGPTSAEEAFKNGFKIKYQDEDGDFIIINSDDDVQMAFEGVVRTILNGESGGSSGSVSLSLFVVLP